MSNLPELLSDFPSHKQMSLRLYPSVPKRGRILELPGVVVRLEVEVSYDMLDPLTRFLADIRFIVDDSGYRADAVSG